EDGEVGGFIREEIRHRGKRKAADVLSDIVVVGAANFSTEGHGVTPLQPAQSVIQHAGGISASLRFTNWSPEIRVAEYVNIRNSHTHGGARGKSDIKIGRIQGRRRK